MRTEIKQQVDKKINHIFKKIDFEVMNGKPKLLIIPCSDKKRASGTHFYERNYFNSEEYKYLIAARELRKYHYKELVNSNPEKFIKLKDVSGNGVVLRVDRNYFIDLIDNNNFFMQAFERDNGEFYSNELRNLYFEKNIKCKLHILIVSGLYGILEFRDEITDYHLKINEGINLWGNLLNDTINQYIIENNIEHNNVFYALSNEYLKKINQNDLWNNLWINNIGNSKQANKVYSAECILKFLQNI